MAIRKGRVPSTTSKGSRRTVETSCVAWFDLLGYGSMLREAAFDPTHHSTELAIERLNKFQEVVEDKTCKYFLSLILNDGGAAYRDLSPRTRSVTYDFIRRTFELHRELNDWEQSAGFPGVRMVVAAGFRIRRKRVSKFKILSGVAKRLIARAQSGEIPVVEAINKAVTIKPNLAATPELAANFAFSKAYIAESQGSKGGLAGPNIFLDSSLIRTEKPKGLELGAPIEWSYPGLDSIFFPVEGVDSVAAGKSQFSAFCNAFEVAENLSSTDGVVERLRKLRVVSGGEA